MKNSEIFSFNDAKMTQEKGHATHKIYTNETIFTWGKHEGRMFGEVDDKYFFENYFRFKNKLNDVGMVAYIESRLDITTYIPQSKSRNPDDKNISIESKKLKFNKEKQLRKKAKQDLRRECENKLKREERELREKRANGHSAQDVCVKRKYETQEIAKRKLTQLRYFVANHNFDSDRKMPRRVYYCGFCDSWHLTSWSRQAWEDRRKNLRDL